MKHFLAISAFFLLFALWLPAPASAFECPDKIKCQQRMMDNNGNVTEQTLGELHAECCYTFPVGCRPWHCKDNDKKWEYWQAKCHEKFPECLNDHAGYTEPYCNPHFVTY